MSLNSAENDVVLKSLKTANTEDFNVLLIKPCSITTYQWDHPDYIHTLLTQDFCSIHTMPSDPVKYLEKIAELLNVNDCESPYIEPHIIGSNKNETYEILYLDYTDKEKEEFAKDKDKYLNQLAQLFDLQEKLIFGCAIIQKLNIPVVSTDMKYENLTIKDLEKMMRDRVYTKVVIYEDDTYREEEIIGPLDIYADKFFEEDKSNYKKFQIPFLKHNLNIWYVANEFGESGVCGKLLADSCKIEKCLFFTMVTDTIRGSLTLEEVEKILYLSKELTDYTTQEDIEREEKDEIGRIIIKNKYRILEMAYQHHKK